MLCARVGCVIRVDAGSRGLGCHEMLGTGGVHHGRAQHEGDCEQRAQGTVPSPGWCEARDGKAAMHGAILLCAWPTGNCAVSAPRLPATARIAYIAAHEVVADPPGACVGDGFRFELVSDRRGQFRSGGRRSRALGGRVLPRPRHVDRAASACLQPGLRDPCLHASCGQRSGARLPGSRRSGSLFLAGIGTSVPPADPPFVAAASRRQRIRCIPIVPCHSCKWDCVQVCACPVRRTHLRTDILEGSIS